MSRTKGSLNKKYKRVVLKKKRGRPKKIVVPAPELPVIKTTKIKFKGYCKCGFMITKKETVSKFIFECPSCGKRGRISTLKKERKNEFKPLTKKEYLETTINTNHYDMPVLNEHHIPPKDLKVQDI